MRQWPADLLIDNAAVGATPTTELSRHQSRTSNQPDSRRRPTVGMHIQPDGWIWSIHARQFAVHPRIAAAAEGRMHTIGAAAHPTMTSLTTQYAGARVIPRLRRSAR